MVRIEYNEGSNLHLHLDSKGILYLNISFKESMKKAQIWTLKVLGGVHQSVAMKV